MINSAPMFRECDCGFATVWASMRVSRSPERCVSSIRKAKYRRGNVLLFFFLALLAFVPLALALFQYGVVTLTRRQMQTAANSAALEGLRHRDQDPVIEPDWRDKAIASVKLTFDADYDFETDYERVGAGPTIGFEDQRIVRGVDIGVYKPELQRNDENEKYGDIVAGDYEIDDPEHVEDVAYDRTDFTPTNPSEPFDSVLVRLRRTNSSQGTAPPFDREPGISSSGSAIPHLWGRGPSSTDDRLDELARGISVRATAIATAIPTMRVGIGDVDRSLIGLLNLQMDIELWKPGQPVNIGSDPVNEAQLIDPQTLLVTTVGEEPYETSNVSHELVATQGYVILTSGNIQNLEGNMIRRIIGFGLAEVNAGESVVTFAFPQPIAITNATGSVANPIRPGWQDLDFSSLLKAINDLTTDDRIPILRSPALARSVGR